MSKRIYLDYNATTPMAPEVLEVYCKTNEAFYGNASSLHQEGQWALRKVEEAQERVASFLDCHPEEVIFTSGATESTNTVFFTLLFSQEPGRIVTTQIEHPSVLACCERLKAKGWEIITLPPDGEGQVPVEAFLPYLEPPTVLVSLMLANNETGVIQPVKEVAEKAKEKGILVHTDAVQGVAKIPVSFNKLQVDYLSSSGHKFYGPKGIGVLIHRKGAPLTPLLVGGGHQGGKRSGTLPVPLIAAFGEACRQGGRWLKEAERIQTLRDRLEAELQTLPGLSIHGKTHPRLPNTCHIGIAGVEGEALMIQLDMKGYAVATGSACSSGSHEVSHVLRAMKIPEEEARGSLRISLGIHTREEHTDGFFQTLKSTVESLRALQVG